MQQLAAGGVAPDEVERAADHVAPGGGDDGVGLGVHAAAQLVPLAAGNAQLLAVAVAELGAVDAPARRAVVARGEDLVVLDDDRAVFAPQAGRAVEHRVGDVEIIFVLTHALVHDGRASFA